MVTGEKKQDSKITNKVGSFCHPAVQELSVVLGFHFQRLDNFFNLMDRSQENGNCAVCEFSSMGRFLLQEFKADAEKIHQAPPK